MHLADGAAGSFVGKVKARYEETLWEFAAQCFESHVFKSKQAEELITYVRNAREMNLNFYGRNFPVMRSGVDKTRENGTECYSISKCKLGIAADETAENLDLRIQPEALEAMIDNENYFSGYHMNKKHCFIILLNGSVPMEEICHRIDSSYLLAVK